MGHGLASHELPHEAGTREKTAVTKLFGDVEKELVPHGIHVASSIIDGAIDGARMHRRLSGCMAQPPPKGALTPAHGFSPRWCTAW